MRTLVFVLLAAATGTRSSAQSLVVPPGTDYCSPSTSANHTVVMGCPCGNDPGALGMGCNNSGGTGGAAISGTGAATLGAIGSGTDTVVISASGIGSGGAGCSGNNGNLTCILVQGDVLRFQGTAFNDGVLCFTGTLRRIQTSTSVGGVYTFSPGTNPTGSSMNIFGPISERAFLLGDAALAPGGGTQTRYYAVWYRDPCGTFACASATSNVSDGYQIDWN